MVIVYCFKNIFNLNKKHCEQKMNYLKMAWSNTLKAQPPWTAFLLFAARCLNALFFVRVLSYAA
jgi:hypothetical protein